MFGLVIYGENSDSFSNQKKYGTRTKNNDIEESMIASAQNVLPLCTPDDDDQVIDIPVERPLDISIPEKEYLELKNAVGYWRTMYRHAILREQ